MRPGDRNLITDVAGLRVGNAEDHDMRTGVTVLVGDQPFTAAVHVMGGAPGTRETDLLAPDKLVQEVDALVLAGGSAFGLDAASGVAARSSVKDVHVVVAVGRHDGRPPDERVGVRFVVAERSLDHELHGVRVVLHPGSRARVGDDERCHGRDNPRLASHEDRRRANHNDHGQNSAPHGI